MRRLRKLINGIKIFGWRITFRKVTTRIFSTFTRKIRINWLNAESESIHEFQNPLVHLIDGFNQKGQDIFGAHPRQLRDNLIPIIHLVEDFDSGGLERFVFDLALAQAKSGQNTVIAYVGHGGKILKEAQFAGLKTIKLSSEAELQSLIENTSANICFTHHCYGILNEEILESIKVVEVFHNPYWWQRGNRELANLREGMYKFIFVSSYVEAFSIEILNVAKSKSQVIENTVSINGKIALESKSREILLSVGNFAIQKNQLLLIKGFQEFKKENLDSKLELWLVGKNISSNIKKIEKRNCNFESEGNIRFLFAKNMQEMHEIYSQSDYFILPSTFEGFSLASLEAFHYGLPIATSYCGGYQELTRLGAGLVLIPNITPSNKHLVSSYIEETSFRPSEIQINSVKESIKELLLVKRTAAIDSETNFNSMVFEYMKIGSN